MTANYGEWLQPAAIASLLNGTDKKIIWDDWENRVVPMQKNSAPFLWLLTNGKFGAKVNPKRPFGVYSYNESKPPITSGFVFVGAEGETGPFTAASTELLGFSTNWTADPEYIDGIFYETCAAPGMRIRLSAGGIGSEVVTVKQTKLIEGGAYYTLVVDRGARPLNFSSGLGSGKYRRVSFEIMPISAGLGNIDVSTQGLTKFITHQNCVSKFYSPKTTLPMETLDIANDPRYARVTGEFNRWHMEHLERHHRQLDNFLITNTTEDLTGSVPMGKGLFGWIEDTTYIDETLSRANLFAALRPRFRRMFSYTQIPNMIAFMSSKTRHAINSLKQNDVAQMNTDIKYIGKSDLYGELTAVDPEEWMFYGAKITLMTHPALEYKTLIDSNNNGVEGQFIIFCDMDNLALTPGIMPSQLNQSLSSSKREATYYTMTEIINRSALEGITKLTIDMISLSYVGLEARRFKTPYNTHFAIGFKTVPPVL